MTLKSIFSFNVVSFVYDVFNLLWQECLLMILVYQSHVEMKILYQRLIVSIYTLCFSLESNL